MQNLRKPEKNRIAKRIVRLRSNMASNTIGAIVLLLVIFATVVGMFGIVSYTKAFRREYSNTTYHMADTATTLVNGDHLDAYLAGEETEEYEQTREALDAYCKTMSVSLIYVIQVDTSDYGRFVSIFNPVDNTVDDTEYIEWELGHKRDTTNDEYRQKYRAIYEEGSPYETVYRIKTTDGQHPHITTLVPVKNSDGDVAAILCMQRPISEQRDSQAPYLRMIVLSTIVLALCTSAFIAVFLRKQVVEPVRKVSDEATRFAKENTKGEPLGAISRYTELANLALSIDTLETDMVSYIENLTAATAERERIGAELSLAGTIQESALPYSFPAFPDRTEFDIYASMDPARAVGGDFYNFFLIDDDHLAMVIGDVSGKGVPGALFMMVTNILIRYRTNIVGSPAEVMSFVNDILCERNKAEMFVTVWLGILEISTGKLTAVNAGHEYPALQSTDGLFALLKDKHGFVIGGIAGMEYQEYELQLEPGAKLFLYTDGVPEATDAENRMFGKDRMLAALNAEPDAAPERILENVRLAVNDFVKDAEQFDDLTMLCLEYRGMSGE